MLASLLDKNKFTKICLIDSNNQIGSKIKISGGAKCNITNEFISNENYLGDKELVKNLLNNFSNKDLLKFLNKNGVFPKINPKLVKGTYFCNSSKDVITMFSKLTSNIKKYLNTRVETINFNEHFIIKTNKQILKTKKLVVASGGLSFPSLNSSSLAFEIALKFSHTIKTLNPALVGFTVQKEQFWFKKLSGVSLMTNAFIENKKINGSLLFTHKGCSGPVILTSSLYWEKGKIILDFLPNKDLNLFLRGNKKISSSLPLSKRFLKEFLESINLEDKAVSTLTKKDKEKLKLLKYYEFSPAGNFGYSKAEVTKGGINTDEINHISFESLKQKNLYFIGECLDITGELGGFNFQIVFSEAFSCAKNLNKDN